MKFQMLDDLRRSVRLAETLCRFTVVAFFVETKILGMKMSKNVVKIYESHEKITKNIFLEKEMCKGCSPSRHERNLL